MNPTTLHPDDYKKLLQTYKETKSQKLFNKQILPILNWWSDVILSQFGIMVDDREDHKQELIIQFLKGIDKVIEANNSKSFTFTMMQNKMRDIFRAETFRINFHNKLIQTYKELYEAPEDIYNKIKPKELRY